MLTTDMEAIQAMITRVAFEDRKGVCRIEGNILVKIER
jgi:hypothetical protein